MADRTAAQALARLYDPQSYADPWEAVKDYRRVIEYSADHPNKGSQAIATALDLPRGRIRPWIDDGRPDPVRAIELADANGWLIPPGDSATFRALACCVAWIFAGGSINRMWVPYFVVNDTTDRAWLDRIGSVLDLSFGPVREGESGRADEWRPGNHASVFGRVLHVRGAPMGAKSPTTRITLPEWLDTVPQLVRREFVTVYLYHRATVREDRAILTFREERDDRYLQSLATLLADVLDGEVSLSGENLIISADAARTYQEWTAPLVEVEAEEN